MVLVELGNQITGALRKLNETTVIDQTVIDNMLKEIVFALIKSDVNIKLVGAMRKRIQSKIKLEEMASGVNKRRVIQKTVFDELVSLVTASRKPFKMAKGKSNVVMFVGLQGSGKTTTVTKYARWYQRKGWKPCVVCADTFRAGAFDQVKQNCTKIKVPFWGSYTEADPVKIAEEGVNHFKNEKMDLIIVDTSGRHKQEAALFDEMQQIESVIEPDNTIFVLDSTIGQAAVDQAKAFSSAVEVGSVIMTKLDGHAKGGGALSAVAETSSPIIFIGTGEAFDDFDSFEPKVFIKRLLGMGDIEGLIKEFKENGILDKQPELMKRFQEGLFTLRDMYEQFQHVMKLGPINRFMDMIPGLPKGLMNNENGGERIKRFMFMMDSMTDDELDGRVTIGQSRLLRIAQGSGTMPQEVTMLLANHKKMEKMVSKMGKTKLMKGDAVLNKQLKRNPKGVMQQLAKSMDPSMLRQMGGAQNMMEMMKKMGGMGLGNMNSLKDLQKMMGKKKR